jgi:hypothetical protein
MCKGGVPVFETAGDYPKEVVLKDGTGVTLRPLKAGDESLLNRMFHRLTEDDRWFFDHDVADLGLVEDWVKNRDLDKVASIVAVLEGEIIAFASLIRKYYGSKSHIGRIRMSVDPSFRERLLGTWVLLDLVNMAMSMDLEMLTMQLVREKDSYFIKSVRKLDFRINAVLKDYAKDREGNSHDLVIMSKRLYRGWEVREVFEP